MRGRWAGVQLLCFFFVVSEPGWAQQTAAQSTPTPVASPSPSPDDAPPAAVAEPEPTPAPTPTPEPAATPTPSPSLLRQAAGDSTGGSGERRDVFPSLNIYLPEGEFDIRLRKLIRNVLFEGQVNYNFVDGDISTYLRYKYYARTFTYKIGVFDSLSFQSLDDTSGDFDRVRGALVQFEYPENYNRRWFLLVEDDRYLLGDVDNPDNRKNNLYTKIGWQFGTQFDERLNSIASDSAGRRPRVLTAFRDLGPRKIALAAGLTQGFESAGDYDYTKLEAEILKRIDVSRSTFLISRLHGGTMLRKSETGLTRDDFPPGQSDFDQPTWAYRIPREEYFKLGGRDALRGVDDHLRGTDEVHLTNEYFVPIFRNRDYRTGIIHWNNLYGIGYVGGGVLGFRGRPAEGFTDYGLSDVAVDTGVGVESSVVVRDYEVFLSAIFATTVSGPEALRGSEFRFSVRTTRY